MKSWKQFIAEAKSDYKLYHNSYTQAVQEVEKFVKKRKFVLDKEEMASEIGMGPRKPGKGKTNRFTLKLYKNEKDLEAGKAQRKAVHFQVYNRGTSSNEYELNVYIS